MVDFKALGDKAVAAGADQTKAKAGGTDFAPALAGPALVRFVGYVELGKQKGTFKGVPNVKEKVQLTFELVGKRHPPHETEDGGKVPQRITIEESLSLNEKAHFFKLFNRLNYKQDANHICQLLGQGFKAEVVHDAWKDKMGKDRISATLKGPAGYTIAPPRKEDEDSETGWVDVAVPPATLPIRCFLWQHADLDQWGSIFIEGEYPERKDDKGVVTAPAKSKNIIQNKIKSAVNFQGSPIHELLVSNGHGVDIPDVGEEDEGGPGNDEPPAGGSPNREMPIGTKTSPSDDALGGIV